MITDMQRGHIHPCQIVLIKTHIPYLLLYPKMQGSFSEQWKWDSIMSLCCPLTRESVYVRWYQLISLYPERKWPPCVAIAARYRVLSLPSWGITLSVLCLHLITLWFKNQPLSDVLSPGFVLASSEITVLPHPFRNPITEYTKVHICF